MKNVLILSASPRKNGNSDYLCDEFARGALEQGNKVEKIFLKDKKINYCLGCEYCAANNGKCVQNDDVCEIIEKMIAADVIVMATPVYFYTMDAQLKTLIDRTVAKYTQIVNKEFYYIVTAADTDKKNLKLTVEALRGYTIMCLEGTEEKGILYADGVWKKDEAKKSVHAENAYNMGRKI